MSLFRRNRMSVTPTQDQPGASLPSAAFPSEMVSGLRRMITQITYQERFPTRLALIAALSGEGVTYTTLALATTLASDLNVRVCAVELNWWSPGMLAQLREPAPAPQPWFRWRGRGKASEPVDTTRPIADTPGLAGVLLGTASLRDAIVSTVLPNLAFLPAGDMPAHQRPAMARGAELKACINQLSRYFDHVLLDVPAILSTSDAMALASLADSCCAVVRQGVTSISSVRQALDDVKHLKAMGIVLNRMRTYTPGWTQALIPQE